MTEAARPYSTLRDGKIVWVHPDEPRPDAGKRSRLESDSEVRSRIHAEVARRKAATPWWVWFSNPTTSKDLDAELKTLGLPPRQMLDEAA